MTKNELTGSREGKRRTEEERVDGEEKGRGIDDRIKEKY